MDLAYAQGGSAWLSFRPHDILETDSNESGLAVGVTQKIGTAKLGVRYEFAGWHGRPDSFRGSLEYAPLWRRACEAFYVGSGLSSGSAVHTFGLKGGVWLQTQGWAGLGIRREVGLGGQYTSIGGSLRYELAPRLLPQG